MENEFPCDIESVISIKVNFENLKVFLEFLDKKNNKNQSQINDIYNKLKEVDVIKEDIKEMNNQIYMINSRQDEMNGTLNYHSSKILEFEKNYVAMDEVN
jgi:seryl-tRNA synthetase